MTDERGFPVGRLVFGAILLLIGAVWLLVTLDLVDVPIQSAMAIGLILIGLVLLFVGRHGGLVTLGVILTIFLGLMSLLNVPLEGGIGDRTFRPAGAADLRSEYRQAIGRLTVDLSEVEEGSSPGDLEITLGMGQLVVVLPDGVPARIEATAGAGQLDLLGSERDGLGAEHTVTEDGATWTIDVSVGFGQVVVRR